MSREKIIDGVIVAKRRLVELGGSKVVSLPKLWLKIQKWLGKEVVELVSIANEIILLVPPDKVDLGIKFLREWEKKLKETEEEK